MVVSNFVKQWKIILRFIGIGLCIHGLYSCSSYELGAPFNSEAVHKKIITKTKPKEWYRIMKAGGVVNMHIFSLVPISKDYYDRKGIAKFYQISENFTSPKELLNNLIQAKRYKNPRIVMKNALIWTAGGRYKYSLPITYAKVLFDDRINGTKKMVMALVDKNNLNKIRWCLEESSNKKLGYLNNSNCLNKYEKRMKKLKERDDSYM